MKIKMNDFRYGRTLSAGGPCASSGQQDVGHEGVATRGGVLSLCSNFALCGVTPGHTFPAGVAALHSN